MKNICLKANGPQLDIVSGAEGNIRGTKKYLNVICGFDTEWDATKRVVGFGYDKDIDDMAKVFQPLNANECLVPDVVTDKSYFTMRVYGQKGDGTLIRTNSVMFLDAWWRIKPEDLALVKQICRREVFHE